MNARHSKRQRDIKSKLMAAIAMLLVSSIMMVSSTYAWFTLSTAPEVTGVTTAVGANGNLEMMLQPMDGNSAAVVSGTGDSMAQQSAFLANTTWGNLVDVSEAAVYGLDKITLYPSQLNYTDATAKTTIGANPLATPSYGADGRISGLQTKTITGVYNQTEEKFLEDYTVSADVTIKNAKGVRAIGISSGMSDRQLAFRAALAAASAADEAAQRTASQSLNTKGAALADIAIKHATSDSEETYSDAELQSLLDICNALLGTAEAPGSLNHIATSLIQYATASALNSVADDAEGTVREAFKNVTIGVPNATGENGALQDSDYAAAENLTEAMGQFTDATNAAVTDNIKKLQLTMWNVSQAKAVLTARIAAADSHAWNDFNTALYQLADPDQMQINGIAVSELKQNWKYKDGDVLPEGYYVADGTESKPGDNGYVYDEDKEIVSNMARLVDAVLGDGLQLIIRSGAGVFADIADFTGDYSASVTLDKVSYGGMSVKNLDATMSTRTSANPTYLDNAATNVGSFKAGTGGSASAAINDYYGYIIDLAFRTNAANSNLRLQAEAVDRVYADGTNEATMGGGASMTFAGATNFTANQVKNLMKCIRVVFFNTDDNKIVGYARLNEATAENVTVGATTGIKMELAMCDDAGTFAESANIMALEQNQVHELSVMVYLDGTTITNADVAYDAMQSMTGTMNLQFSSDATLVPMNYTDLKQGTGETTPTASDVTATLTGLENGTVTAKYGTYNGVSGIVAVIKNAAGDAVTSGTVKINNVDATYNAVAGGWLAVIAEKPASATVAYTAPT